MPRIVDSKWIRRRDFWFVSFEGHGAYLCIPARPINDRRPILFKSDSVARAWLSSARPGGAWLAYPIDFCGRSRSCISLKIKDP